MFKRRHTKQGFKATGSPGKRAYAVGDVHGCARELSLLLDAIEADNAARRPKPTFLVFLGDLIDRGPASKDVVDMLLNERRPLYNYMFLKGNHEEMLVRGLRGEPGLIAAWLEHGGYECAESYGVQKSELAGQSQSSLEHILLSAIPDAHISFMADFHDSIRFGDYVFVHAGIRPGVAIEAQTPRDLRWIRHEFLDSDKDHGAIIVHGHTVTEDICERTNRIGLDTGAYKGGALSALMIDGTERAFLGTNGALSG